MNSRESAPAVDASSLEWREKTISELFHVISQPLTGLHCLLEVSLMKKQSAAGYRRDIQSALEATSRLVDSLRQARELAEADSAGKLVPTDLSQLVAEILSEFEPLLEASHIRPVASIDAGPMVLADATKLRRAIFYLFDNVLHDLPLGNELFVTTRTGSPTILYVGQMQEPDGMIPVVERIESQRSVAVAIRTVGAFGGILLTTAGEHGRAFRVELPIAPV